LRKPEVKKLSAKEMLAQKVLVRTINEFLRQGTFTLKEDENLSGSPVITFDMGGIPAIAAVSDIGHGELSVKVALWPSEHGRQFIHAACLASAHPRKCGAFYANAWLERKKGAWLQTSNGLPLVSCANDKQVEVERLQWEEPLGYLASGKSFT